MAVTTFTGKKLTGRVLTYDMVDDLALVEVETLEQVKYPNIAIIASVGQTAIAIGHP